MSVVSDRIRKWVSSHYPAVVNGTAHPLIKYVIQRWWIHHPGEHQQLQALESLKAKIQKQPEHSPSPAVLQQIQRQLPSTTQPVATATFPWQLWLVPLLFLILAAFLLQQALPPVIQVNWTLQGDEVEAFRVYRIFDGEVNVLGAENSSLIREIAVDTTRKNYGFVDTPLFPGAEIVYRIDVVGKDGLLTDTTTWVGNGLTTFFGQLLMAVIGILILYVLWLIGQHSTATYGYQQVDLM